ncbi:MAG: alpha-L-fucosidase [Gemmatimonadaceae bacterium]
MNRRHFVRAGAASVAAGLMSTRLPALTIRRTRALPSSSQLQWQRDELAMFLHFGVNTFTDREWGDGRESPAIFNPVNLDARQWARTARAAGFRSVILTAKHHDGFCLWPSRTTDHTVAKSPWRGGSGDVVREMVDACRAEGLRPGLYLSPWDRNNAAYGNSAVYNDLYSDQLTELLTRYGPLAEVWFDGANGEGPNGKKQVYDWPRTFAIVRRHQPEAVIFSDAGPDVRWCGNEQGAAGDPNWSTVDPSIVTYPGASGNGIIDALQHGSPDGTVWRPAECDTSIRPGWFYHPADDAKVRTVDDLVDLYHLSVGRNAKLLLNVPPTRDGLLHDTDVARLTAFRSQLNTLKEPNVATGAESTWKVTGARTAELEMTLARPTEVSAARLEEDITKGQLVARYSLLGADGGAWRPLLTGTTIGYARLQRFLPMKVRRLKLVIEDAIDVPEPVSLTV